MLERRWYLVEIEADVQGRTVVRMNRCCRTQRMYHPTVKSAARLEQIVNGFIQSGEREVEVVIGQYGPAVWVHR